MFGTTPTDDKKVEEELSTDKTPDEEEPPSEAVEEQSKDEDITEVTEDAEEPSAVEETPEVPEAVPEPEPEPEPELEIEPEPEVIAAIEVEEEYDPNLDAEILEPAIIETEEPGNEDLIEIEEAKSDTPESQKVGIIEGVVNGEDEIETLNNDENNEDLKGAANGVEDAEVMEMVESGNMEQLATLVLNGEGDRLIGQQSNNHEIQAFLENVPIYMVSKQKQIYSFHSK